MSVVGKPTPLVDARLKVTGRGVYTDDIKLPGMLVGKILRSPLPYARIASMDTARAEALPGVRAVVTGRESTASFGVLPVSQDETAMAVDRVLYVGDCVAGVAAEDEEIALEACRLIDVRYEPLAPIMSIDDALQPTDVPIHPKFDADGRLRSRTNLHKAVEQEFGDVQAAFAGSAFVERRVFNFAPVTHAFTEPHCVIALYDHDDRLTVWSATQVPHYLHRALSAVMGMEMHRIRVIRPMVGGAFGGKSDPFPHEMIAALLSRRVRQPVKILFDREEVFLTNHGRHPTRTDMTMGVTREGKLTGLDLKSHIDGGAWGSFGVVTTYYNGVLCMGPYRIDNFRYAGKRVYTNKPPSGAMRGHGAVNSRCAMEVLVDILAEKVGMDPIDFRLANLLPSMTRTINEFRITSNGTRECLEKVRAASRWDQEHGKLPYGEGIGVACGFYISGSALPIHWNKTPQSTVHIKIDADGGVTVHSMAAEIGQGSDTMLAQCVAEPLGLSLSRIRVYCADSDMAPIDLGSYSSRVTFMAGNAARRAAEAIRADLVEAAARLSGYPAEGFVLRDEKAVYAPNPAITVPYMDALAEAMHGKGALVARGCYAAAPPMGGKHKGAAAGLSPSYTFQAYVARVSVDPESGFVTVRHVWAAHDCGRALNPTAVVGQIVGCVHMGLGQALTEDFRYNRANVLDANLLDYRTLTPRQMPPVDVFVVETLDPEGPFGAKEAGEGPILPVAPAVANAIYDAVGARLLELPMTPDRVLDAIVKSGGGSPGPHAGRKPERAARPHRLVKARS